MSNQIWKVTYEDNSYGAKQIKVKEFEEPVKVDTVISWRNQEGHVIHKVEKTGDRVTWEDITKIASWR